jgi:hypothetical protein
MSGFRFGQAQVVITPPIGTRLSGFEERDHGCVGVHDDLFAKTWVFDDGSGHFALTLLDLVSIDLDMVEAVRKRVSEATKLAPHEIHFVCTHTHSGPAGLRRAADKVYLPQGDPELVNIMERHLAGCVIAAWESLREGRLGFGQGRLTSMCTNRRDPNGPMDPEVTVLRVEEADGRLAGVIVNYANHPTTLNAENYLVTRDYPGFMCDAIAHVKGKGVQVGFAQGTAGDISARWTRRGTTFAEAERLGHMLAGEALRVLETVETTTEARVRSFTRKFEVPMRKLPPLAEAEAALAAATARLESLKAEGAPYGDVRTAYVSWQGADRTARMARQGRPSTTFTEVGLLSLNGHAIALLPGEALTRTGLDLKAAIGTGTIVLGYANDSMGYLIPLEEDGGGSYETGASLLAPEAVQTMKEQILALAREM